MTWAEKDRDPREQLGDSPLGDSMKHGRHSWDGSEANTKAPVNQSGPKGKEVKVTGEKAEESAVQCAGGSRGQGTRVCVCFASTTMCLTRCTEVVLLGADALGA